MASLALSDVNKGIVVITSTIAAVICRIMLF